MEEESATQEDTGGIKDLREAAERGKKATQENDALKREMAFLKAGVDTESKAGQLLFHQAANRRAPMMQGTVSSRKCSTRVVQQKTLQRDLSTRCLKQQAGATRISESFLIGNAYIRLPMF